MSEFDKFLEEISGCQDISKIPEKLPQTEQEKEHSLFVKMCYLISGDKRVYDLMQEEWDELEKYGMVRKEKRKMGIKYYATEKALAYVESVDSDYEKKVKAYRNDNNELWDICDDPNFTVDGVKAQIGNII